MFLFKTPGDVGMLFVRVALGASLLPHGLEKLGLFDNTSPGLFEYAGTKAAALGSAVGGDPWLGWLAIIAEVVGSVSLIVGFFGRFCALAIGGVMVMAAWKAGGLEAGQYLDWWRDAPGATTYGSYHILAVGAAIAILIRGSGALSVDRAITR